MPHQANSVMLAELLDTLDLPNATQHLVVERLGNPGSASIAITLSELATPGQAIPGDYVLLAAFGGACPSASPSYSDERHAHLLT